MPATTPPVHLPPPPAVPPLFLRVLGLNPPPSLYTTIPPIDQLANLNASLQECLESAGTRASNSREGGRIGREMMGIGTGGVNGKGKRKAGGAGDMEKDDSHIQVKEEPSSILDLTSPSSTLLNANTNTNKSKKASSIAPSSTHGDDIHVQDQIVKPKRVYNSKAKGVGGKANSGRGGAGSQSPAPKMERDGSASPAPTDHTINPDPLSTSNVNKKKRKLTHPHDADGGISVAENGVGVGETGMERGGSGSGAGFGGIKLKMGGGKSKNAGSPITTSTQVFPSHLAASINFNLPSHLASSSTPTNGSPAPWQSNTNPSSHLSSLNNQSHSQRSLVPPRQPIPAPPKPGPKRQKDVNADYSIPKPGSGSTNFATFWNYIEPYLKDIGEDDLAMLRFRSEDADGYLFKIPRLGRHYQEVWDLEDSMLPFRDEVFGVQAGSSTNGNGNGAGVGLNRNGSGGGDRPRRFIPARDLMEDDLYDDARGLGGLTERITAGMMTIEDGENGDGHRDGDQSANTDGQNGDSATMMAMVKQEEDTNAEAGPGPTTIAINDLHKNGHHPSHDHHHPNERLNGFPTSSSDSEENEEIMIDTRWPIGPHSIGGGVGDGLDGSGSGLDAMNTAVDELEVGMKRELALLGLVEQDQEIDWSLREDDEISCALRQCQRLLKVQLAINNARKDRLASIVRDRLAFAEYKRSLDGLEKVIETTWLKRVSKKSKKSRKKDMSGTGTGSAVGGAGNHVPLDELTKKALMTRQKWIESIGTVLKGEDVQGRYMGIPEKSIYEGIEMNGRGLVMDEEVIVAEAGAR